MTFEGLCRVTIAMMTVMIVSWTPPGYFSVLGVAAGTEAIKMTDPDSNSSIDLAEAKIAAREVFLKLGPNHDGMIGVEKLAGRYVDPDQLSYGANPWMFWRARTRYTKDQYLLLVETWFVAADINNDGVLEANEFQTPAGQQFFKLVR